MKRYIFLVFTFLFLSLTAQDLKSPSEFLGYGLGTQFTRHHQVVDYYQYLADQLPNRISLVEYGTTYEGRPLLLATLSSEENMANLEAIRQEHLRSTQGASTSETAIVWLSYNVHGNESVSTEASMRTVYELLTDKSKYLDRTVVLIDPCVNPDGRDRYVNWYNQHKNTPHHVDPNSWEHHEGWWNGRSNHYMFDLNRDWAWLTQTESQHRLRMFNRWIPHVHVDFHEQGVDAPYYFAPAAEPYHEVITDFQREFQEAVGRNHAKYFDANGWFYFTKEIFDLLYPSYGDTYPTYNGSIGMTYEQGGSGRAGLGIINSIGDTLTLKDRIEHHYTTGLSTLEIVSENVDRLVSEFQKFHGPKDYRFKSYVLQGNKHHLDALATLLDQHGIRYGQATKGTARGVSYTTGKNAQMSLNDHTVVVPTDQPKGTLVKVLFEPNAKLTDSLTYDITAWSLPYAYGLEAIASTERIAANPVVRTDSRIDSRPGESAYAYIAEWNSLRDARFLAALLQSDIRVRYAQQPFSLEGREFGRGSLIIAKPDNSHQEDFVAILGEMADLHKIPLTAASTGFVSEGKDFGSHFVQPVRPVKVAILAGEPASTYRFGEIWHFFERQLQYPLTTLHSSYMDDVDLSEYDVLILPGGDGYTKYLTSDRLEGLRKWVENGGKLIAMGGALKGLAGKKGFCLMPKETVRDSVETPHLHELSQREQIKGEITGAIFKSRVDFTHPLAFGYGDTYFTLKLGDAAFSYLDSGSVVYLEEGGNVPVSGFAGSEARAKIAETLIFGAEELGEGQIVYMVDNPLFRGFWENGKLFFANALFLVD